MTDSAWLDPERHSAQLAKDVAAGKVQAELAIHVAEGAAIEQFHAQLAAENETCSLLTAMAAADVPVKQAPGNILPPVAASRSHFQAAMAEYAAQELDLRSRREELAATKSCLAASVQAAAAELISPQQQEGGCANLADLLQQVCAKPAAGQHLRCLIRASVIMTALSDAGVRNHDCPVLVTVPEQTSQHK